MKYYLMSTIGTGTERDPVRPRVANYQCDWSAIYERPEQKNAIVAVNADPGVLAKIEADEEITLLSDSLEELVTNTEFQRICPEGKVMVYG